MKGQQPYAITKEYRNLHDNVFQSNELQDPNDPIMLTFQQAGILGTHFTAVAETNNLRKIVCQRILSRVVCAYERSRYPSFRLCLQSVEIISA